MRDGQYDVRLTLAERPDSRNGHLAFAGESWVENPADPGNDIIAQYFCCTTPALRIW